MIKYHYYDLVSLYSLFQGINGILADEMGLGKTVQSICTLAHLAEAENIWGPFMVIAPLSTLTNWHSEFERFTPQITVCINFVRSLLSVRFFRTGAHKKSERFCGKNGTPRICIAKTLPSTFSSQATSWCVCIFMNILGYIKYFFCVH